MIITVGGIKGGSGKSTVATHLAVLRAQAGREVLLVDADGQATATDFTKERKARLQGKAGYTAVQLSGRAVRTETLELARKYDDVVIDTGGRDTASQRAALSASNIVLIPMVPRSADVWTLRADANLVDEMRMANAGLAAWVFVNRADPRGTDNEETAEAIAETQGLVLLPVRIGYRKAFGNAMGQGMAVTELRPRDAKAVQEIEALCQEVEGFDGDHEKSRR